MNFFKHLFLGRPLAVFCFLTLTVLAILMIIKPQLFIASLPETLPSSYIYGRVTDKSIKDNKLTVYLNDISFYNSNDNTLQSLPGITGAICYFDNADFIPAISAYVVITGDFKEFTTPSNPGEFDYKIYYMSKGYHFSLRKCSICSYRQPDHIIRESLYKLREQLSASYDNILSPDDSALLKGITLGDKSQIDTDIRTLFQSAGISHILSISGLHISIIGFSLFRFLKKTGLPIGITIPFSLLVTTGYCVMTGMSTATVRALFMFFIMLISQLFKRTYDIITSLLVIALMIVIVNPLILLTSGFWLSFIAVFGIAVFSKVLIIPPVKDNYKRLLPLNSLLTSFAVSIFTFPLVLYFYYSSPIYSLFLNLLIIPLMGLLTGLALISSLTGLYSVYLGSILAIPCHIILTLYRILCDLSLRLPFHTITAGKPAIWKICLFYCICFCMLILHKYRNYKASQENDDYIPPFCITIIKPLILLTAALIFIPYNAGLKVTFINVGQGDGICMQADNTVIMIDGGSTSEKNLAQNTLLPFFSHEGITSIDYWFISHPDEDHQNGLIQILSDPPDNLKIKTVLLSDSEEVKNESFELIELCALNNIPVSFISCGDKLITKSMSITCISPSPSSVYNDINSYSEVLYAEYYDLSILLTGDATIQSEKDYIENCKKLNINLESTSIFKVGHHGSSTSTGNEIEQLINKGYAIISSGKNNRYGHPHTEVIDALNRMNMTIYDTKYTGAVTVYKNKRKPIKISGFL